jgi:hypothetical protein
MKIKLANVRLAFPELFEAKQVNGEGKPAFSASFLLEKGDKQNAAIEAAINEVAKAKWGAKADQILKQMKAGDKTALHDGDLKSQYAGFEGMNFVSARNPVRPLVIDRDKSPLAESDGKPYAGCYVNVSLELWAQDNNFGKRINASLGGVQFVKDGDRFAGGSSADESDFDELEAGADADDLV